MFVPWQVATSTATPVREYLGKLYVPLGRLTPVRERLFAGR